MIEKIRTTEQGLYNEHGTFLGTMPKDTDSLTLANKINELVDAVNELTSCVGQLGVEFADTTPVENVQDKFAEQRKWIGKLCKFWDDDNTNLSCGILTSIDTETFKEPQFVCNDEYDYEHCKPVKPDDDIIYKGE